MEHKPPELPYAKTSLAPHISAETLEYHHGKHHAAYIANLNKLLAGTELAELSPEDIVKQASGAIFNNVAQVWNHSFHWHSLSPKGGGEHNDALAVAIAKVFCMGLAGQELRWGAGNRIDQQRSDAAQRRQEASAYRRRMGTRLLHRLSQRPASLPGSLLEAGELGVRSCEPKVAQEKHHQRVAEGA